MITTTRPKRRAAKAAAVGAGLVGSALGLTAAPAEASASGCTYGGFPVDRCVYVNGSSTYVNYIDGTIRYRTGLRLQVEVWGDGVYYRGYGSPYTASDTTYVRIPVYRHLANGSWVCVAARWSDGRQVSPACVQIRR